MLDLKDVKPGILVWWSADRVRGSSWSCPALIIEVLEDSFSVKSLDDFKTTSLRLHDGPPGTDVSCRHEMRLSNIAEVEEFFTLRRDALENEITKKSRALREAQKNLSQYETQIKTFLEKMT